MKGGHRGMADLACAHNRPSVPRRTPSFFTSSPLPSPATGWGVCLGGAMVLACMAMSAFTQVRNAAARGGLAGRCQGQLGAHIRGPEVLHASRT